MEYKNLDWKALFIKAFMWLIIAICKALAFLLFITLILVEHMCKGLNGLLYRFIFNRQMPQNNGQ